MDACDIKTIVAKTARSAMMEEFDFEGGSNEEIGEHYFGNLKSFKITGKKEGKEVKLQVLIKTPPKIECLRNEGLLTTMYEREIYFYEKIQPIFRGIDSTFPSPMCYFTRGEVMKEAIVLEDLRWKGYRNFESMFLDFEHIEMSIKSLAQFHALSVCLERRFPKEFEEFKEVCWSFEQESNMNRTYIDCLGQTLDETAALIGGEIGNTLRSLKKNCLGDLMRRFDRTEIKVMCHGDLWKNNILFKYKNEHVHRSSLLDFQFIHIGSAARDLLHLISTSTDSALRHDSFRTLTQTYLQQLNIYLHKYNVHEEDFCTWEKLESDLKTVAPSCLIMATHAFQNWCGIADFTREIFGLPVCGEGEEMEKMKRKFSRIMSELVADFRVFGLID